MIVGPVCNDFVTEFFKFFCHSFTIRNNLSNIIFIFFCASFFGTNSLASYNVFKRTALTTWKYRTVNRFCEFFFAENQSASRTTKRFMCCRCNNICNTKRRLMNTCSYQSCNMSHIDHKIRSLIFFIYVSPYYSGCFGNHQSDLFEINFSRICARASKDKFGLI